MSSRGRIRLPSDPSAPGPFKQILLKLWQSRSPSEVKRVLNKRIRIETLPLKVRPLYIVLTSITLFILSLLGFHPTLASKISPPVPFWDKILHFVCFFVASFLFYKVWSVDQERREWYWRWWKELISAVVCCGAGGLGSEWVQSWLPYKTFQWGDVVANLLGSTLGILLSRHFHIRRRRELELARLYQPVRMDPVGTTYPGDDDESSTSSDVEDSQHQQLLRTPGGEGVERMEEGRLRAEAAFLHPTSPSGVGGDRPLTPLPPNAGSGLLTPNMGTPGGRRSTSSPNPRRSNRPMENVWDDSEEIFGVGSDDDEDEGGGKGKNKGKSKS